MMGRKPFVGGNWKTKKPHLAGAEELARYLVEAVRPIESVEVVVFPQDSHLYQIGQILALAGSNIGLGSQNVWKGVDPSTGELPIETLAEAGGRYAIIGHSEQRHKYGETDSLVGERLKAVEEYNSHRQQNEWITPIVCIGETLDERNASKMFDVLIRQLRALDINPYSVYSHNPLVIAYEPVWAIGTGVNASPEQAQEAHAFIRSQFGCPYFAEKGRIIYGGSVTSDKAQELIAQPDIDGFLVGNASLKAAEFSGIANIVRVVKTQI